jgi:catechol 2,3-dioxygenase-like lactoylglutathione lyase family enzyme
MVTRVTGAHVMLYSRDPEADRAFLRDVLGWRGVDAGAGWLIFKLPPAEVAVHPTEGEPRHELYLVCPHLATALAALAAKSVTITHSIRDMSGGRWATIKLPSGADLSLYEPRHPTAYDLEE